MLTAIIGDIHSNSVALEACLADARVRGVECYVFLGDYVSDLAYPRKTMDMLYSQRQSNPCYFVRGNRENYLLSARKGETAFSPGSKSGSLGYTYSQLREDDFTFFEALPIYRQIHIDRYPLEIAHAEQDTDRHVFEPDGEYIGRVFETMETNLLLTAHSHLQYVRQREGKIILNPGALGLPIGKPGFAQYAVAEISSAGVRPQLLQIPYDVPRLIRETWDSGIMEMAFYWPIAALNNVLTGTNSTIDLVERVHALDGAHEEEIWARSARELGLAVTEEEMLARWHGI